MGDVMDSAGVPHFSGLRLDELRLSSSTPSSPSSAKAASYSGSPYNLSSPVDAAKQPFVIGVSGGTASGKTTVCDMIIQQLHDHRVVLVNQDSFYRGLTAEESEHVQDYNFDHPDAFDTEQLLECMNQLKCCQSVNVPIYDFKNHRRCSESFRKVNASDVIILEGILAFHDQRVRDLLDMKIFVDTGISFVLRKIYGYTLQNEKYSTNLPPQKTCHYGRFVKPAFDDFVLPTKKYADVIIPRGGDNHVAIDLIVQHIRTKLGQHDLWNCANQAIDLLIRKGVPENHIIFLNLISAPEGIHAVCKRFPAVKIVTSEIDGGLNEEYRVIPGLGEFGDRYFGTDN
ncbi:Uridine kinase-like 3 isoform 3 [Carex littledalei]|uniref:uridine/cytidine kinase n=1 Tax=Carex littledalei TaxID=544730 RepID=A0A833QJA6_9POAL|nr:Uridine kinase-like 3 isoform 3 [Carex littledalei]